VHKPAWMFVLSIVNQKIMSFSHCVMKNPEPGHRSLLPILAFAPLSHILAS
jgi:hypothetical protein